MPPVNEQVRGTGYSQKSITVSTRRTLKVSFTPGVQDTNLSGTGYTINYAYMGVFIKVGSETKPTPLLYNGYLGGNAETTTAMDFSSSVPNGCTTSSADTCRQSVTITVKQPNTDFRCLNYGTNCSHAHVEDGHPWNGTIRVQTDDTDAL